MEKYSVDQLYDLALKLVQQIVYNRTMFAAVLVGVAVFLMAMSVSRLGTKRTTANAITAIIVSIIAFLMVRGDLGRKQADIGHELANVAITAGVDQARKAQATELQYIHAPIIEYGSDVVTCQEEHYPDGTYTQGPSSNGCSGLTDWYDHWESDVWWDRVETCTTDDEGKEKCDVDYVKHWKDNYRPWFGNIYMRWCTADTKFSYLQPDVYTMKNVDGKPRIYLHTDWRAPEFPERETFNGRAFDQSWRFVNRVPEFWMRVRAASQGGYGVVVGTFVGQYFHWGLAAESAQFGVYDGHYKTLLKYVTLPGPNGVTFHYKDAFGKSAVMKTLVTSKDQDLALDFAPVTFVGFKPNPIMEILLNTRALEFQGHFGPNKQASARWFLVADSVVQNLGGLNNVTTALKAYLNDTSVWGQFQLPKNVAILVASVSDDGTKITGRDMETGMPYGNTLVMERMRLSMKVGEQLPLSSDTLFGVFTSKYLNASGKLEYKYSEMADAGAAIGLLYENTPNWKAPDPNSEECETAPAEHLGFVRYQMCTQQYRESTIKINRDGAELIIREAQAAANERTSLLPAIIILVLSLIVVGSIAYNEYQS